MLVARPCPHSTHGFLKPEGRWCWACRVVHGPSSSRAGVALSSVCRFGFGPGCDHLGGKIFRRLFWWVWRPASGGSQGSASRPRDPHQRGLCAQKPVRPVRKPVRKHVSAGQRRCRCAPVSGAQISRFGALEAVMAVFAQVKGHFGGLGFAHRSDRCATGAQPEKRWEAALLGPGDGVSAARRGSSELSKSCDARHPSVARAATIRTYRRNATTRVLLRCVV